MGGGLQGISSFSKGFESKRIRSHFPGINSGAVVAKKMSRFEVIRLRFGMAIVCTRLPFIIRRISIVSSVKAITYGKAQAADRNRALKRYYSFISRQQIVEIFNRRTYGYRHRIPIEVELGRRSVLFRQFLKVTGI